MLSQQELEFYAAVVRKIRRNISKEETQTGMLSHRLQMMIAFFRG